MFVFSLLQAFSIPYHSYQSLVLGKPWRETCTHAYTILPLTPLYKFPVAGLCSIFWYSRAVDLQRNYQWSIFWGMCNKLLLTVYVKFFFCGYCWQKVFHMHFSFSSLWPSMALFKRKKSLKITMTHILWKSETMIMK